MDERKQHCILDSIINSSLAYPKSFINHYGICVVYFKRNFLFLFTEGLFLCLDGDVLFSVVRYPQKTLIGMFLVLFNINVNMLLVYRCWSVHISV